jgi:hypothetical protein
MILLILASQVARITGMSYWLLVPAAVLIQEVCEAFHLQDHFFKMLPFVPFLTLSPQWCHMFRVTEELTCFFSFSSWQ